MIDPVLIARCPQHGLHGARTDCHVCGGPVEQVPMVLAADEHARRDRMRYQLSEALRAAERLYAALAVFDTRDGLPESRMVQAAREGYERSSPEVGEDAAWDEFDARIAALR